MFEQRRSFVSFVSSDVSVQLKIRTSQWTKLTFRDLELVVLLVPQTTSLTVDDPHRKV